MTTTRTMSGSLAGSAAGLAASIPMLCAMEALRRGLPGQPESHYLPPRKVATGLARKAGIEYRMTERTRKAVTLVGHVSYGAAMGAAYGVIAGRTHRRAGRNHLPRSVAQGVAWGLAVWALSYAGWLPAAGILPPPHRRSARRNTVIIGSHVVWGAVLGALTDQMRRR